MGSFILFDLTLIGCPISSLVIPIPMQSGEESFFCVRFLSLPIDFVVKGSFLK